MPLVTAVKNLMARLERFFVYRVLHLDDTPHRIALGVAIGIFVAWTPTIPFQMVSTVALCWLFRANKLVGVPFVWISNPFTLVPIYGPNLLLGQWILGRRMGDFSAFDRALQCDGGFWDIARAWYDAIQPVFVELWLGSLIVATLLGIGTYFTLYRIINVSRRKLHAWHEKHGQSAPPPEGPGEPPIQAPGP